MAPVFVPDTDEAQTQAQVQVQTKASSEPWVELDGQRYPIRAKVHQVSGYSAHAGQDDLLAFATAISPPPKQIRLVHGEARAKAVLQQKLRELLPDTEVLIP